MSSVFDAGKGKITGEIVEKSFPIEGVTVRVRVKPKEIGFADVFEDVPVWLSHDQIEEGSQAGWIGKDFEEYLDEEGKKQIRILGNIFLLNAARLENQTGIARMIQCLVTVYDAGFDEAKRVVTAAAEAVGIQEAEDEVFKSTFLAAAEDVQNAAESTKQKALAAARQALALQAAPAASADDTPAS